MIKGFYDILTRLNNKYPLLRNNPFYRYIRPLYWKIKIVLYSVTPKRNESAISFYAQNAERVKTVSNMLADEKSKRTYLDIIKYRQTGNKKDFPLYGLELPQYFIKEIILNENEIFIDCGAFTGDTIDDFLRCCKKKYKHIVALEPDIENFKKLEKHHGNNPKVTLINAGAYDKCGKIYFSVQQGSTMGKIINELNNEQVNAISIPVQTIDSLNLEKVSFIKMDIEGAELSALRGGEMTILRDKPKLAICIYHSNEDMIDIAEYIHNLMPEYKLYVRCHLFLSYVETVLYAIPF